jgi:brefeldin A-inhibited guanine nucleotide-exchange protein
VQKLVAYGGLPGHERDPEHPDRTMVDAIVDTVCASFLGENTDEAVLLQIIKALMTCVTSSTLSAHDGQLLKVVRTCYNVYLCAKSQTIATTSKASLTQMLNVIFVRMEDATVRVSVYCW